MKAIDIKSAEMGMVNIPVKTYPIQEHELLALDDLGRNSTLWTAIGSATLALVGSCVWSMLQNPASTTPGATGFAVLLLFVSVASFLIGRAYGKRRQSRLEKIMEAGIADHVFVVF